MNFGSGLDSLGGGLSRTNDSLSILFVRRHISTVLNENSDRFLFIVYWSRYLGPCEFLGRSGLLKVDLAFLGSNFFYLGTVVHLGNDVDGVVLSG